jgi:hypothetical protein
MVSAICCFASSFDRVGESTALVAAGAASFCLVRTLCVGQFDRFGLWDHEVAVLVVAQPQFKA